jgi:hypothetical protein
MLRATLKTLRVADDPPTSVPGVGAVTGHTLIANLRELGQLERARPKKVALIACMRPLLSILSAIMRTKIVLHESNESRFGNPCARLSPIRPQGLI